MSVEKNNKKPLTSMVDYVRVTFKTHDIDFIIQNIVHLDKEFMTQKFSGRYGYIGTFELDYIKVYYSLEGDSRGILVEMSGQGCRQFETFLRCRKKTWFDFFDECIENGGSFTRLDLAIDDRKTYFLIPRLLNKSRRGESVSRFKKAEYDGSFDLGDGSHKGTTIYFGSQTSSIYLCFYEKNYEQSERHGIPLEDLGKWNRYELRLNDERAQVAIKALIHEQNLTYIALKIINNYLRFVDPLEGKEKRHWKVSKFWERFIGDVGKLQLYMQPNEDFYQKSKNWLVSSCAPTMKMVLKADEKLFTTELSDMILNAELSDKQEKMLSVYLANIEEMVV